MSELQTLHEIARARGFKLRESDDREFLLTKGRAVALRTKRIDELRRFLMTPRIIHKAAA